MGVQSQESAPLEITAPKTQKRGSKRKGGVNRKDRPSNAKGYLRRKWGSIAKEFSHGNGGAKRKGLGMERKKLKLHYDVDRLLEIGRDRGYRNRKELWHYLMASMRYGNGYNQFRIKMAMGRITFPQVKLFADALQMTPEEMIDVFFGDTFVTVGNRTFAELSEEDKHIFGWRLDRQEIYRNIPTRKPKKHSVEEMSKQALEEINALFDETVEDGEKVRESDD